MTVCKYFQQGRCAFGNDCKFEHTQDKTKQNTFGNQSWTAGPSRSTTKSGGIFTIESMTKDLKPGQEKPLWPLGSYGPGRFQPVLVGGIDESFEELRWRAVTAFKSGTINDYTKYESDKITAADQIYSNALTNISQAFDQAQRQFFDPDAQPADTSEFAGEPAGPTSSAFGGGTMSAFGAAPTPTSAFGQPAFGQSTFGQSTPSQTANSSTTPATTSVFGQPQQTSAFGQTSQPDPSIIKPASGAFGSSASGGAFSAFAGSGVSAFGSGSSPSGGGFSAFAAQPSAFGSGASNTPASSGGSVFGQSSFGNAPAATSAFGAPAQGTTTSAFAQPSGFGTSQPATGSAFGGSAFSTANAGSVFGPGGSASTNPIATNPSGSVFGPGGSAFTSAANTGSVFGSGENAPTNAFSSNNNSLSAFTTPPQAATSVFGNPSTSPSFSSQPTTSLPEKPQPGPPNFSAATSTYKPDIDKYDSMLPDNYVQLLPPVVKVAFESNKFEWGKVPEWTPPKELR